MSKNEILNKVKSVTQKRKSDNDIIKPAYLNIRSEGDLKKNFLSNLEANKSQVFECKEEELSTYIEKILKKENIKKVMYFEKEIVEDIKNIDMIFYDKSINEMSETLFSCDASVVRAKMGISNLGIFCISSDEQPRLMSLLPQTCIVLLPKENIVNSLNHVFEKIEKLPTNIVFIAGPSRTADIELKLVMGVHGPQKVYVLLY